MINPSMPSDFFNRHLSHSRCGRLPQTNLIWFRAALADVDRRLAIAPMAQGGA